MDFLAAITQPAGLWEKIIIAFEGGVGNYALAIILITLIIRIIWIPFDFFNKKINRKNMRMQEKLKPELALLQKKYGNDKNVLNQKTGELYKKNNFNMMGSCAYMIVFFILNMAIFFTLFAGMNNMATYKISTQYEELKQTYAQVLDVELNGQPEINADTEVVIKIYTSEEVLALINNEAVTAEMKDKAQKLVNERYLQIRDSFLWIDNVWKADSPFVNSVPSYEDSGIVITVPEGKTAEEIKILEKSIYDTFMNPIRDEYGKVNGYLIIAILSVITSLLATFLMNGKISKKDKKPKSNILLLVLMPVLMGAFAIFYNSIFGIYMVVGQVVNIATAPLINLILKKVEEKEEIKKEKAVVVDYRRK